MWFESFSVVAAIKLQCLDIKFVFPLIEVQNNLRDMSEICLERITVSLFFKDPVCNGSKVIEARAHVSKEFIGTAFITPEVLHPCKAIEHVFRCREPVFNRIQIIRKMRYIEWLFNFNDPFVRVLLVELHEGLVILPLPRSETVKEHEVLLIQDITQLEEYTLGGFVETYIDDILVVSQRLPYKVVDEYLIRCACFDFPDNIITGIE